MWVRELLARPSECDARRQLWAHNSDRTAIIHVHMYMSCRRLCIAFGLRIIVSQQHTRHTCVPDISIVHSACSADSTARQQCLQCTLARVFLCSAGSGAHEDIVVSSARAYVSALNKMIGWMSVAVKVQPKSGLTGSSATSRRVVA